MMTTKTNPTKECSALPKDDLRKLEKSEHYQRVLLLSVILLLVTFIVAVFMFSDIRGLYKTTLGSYGLHLLLSGMLILAVMLVTYIGLKDRSIRILRNNLIREQTSQAVMDSEAVKLETLMEVVDLLSSGIERHAIFDTICSGLVKCLKGDESSLMSYNPQSETLTCVSYVGAKRDLVLGREVKLGESVAGWVIQHRTPLLLDKDLSQHRFLKFVDKERKISSGICVPLELDGEIKGVLNISLIDGAKHKFDKNDLRLAKIFAQNAVLAMDRAQMYVTTEKLKQPAQVESR